MEFNKKEVLGKTTSTATKSSGIIKKVKRTAKQISGDYSHYYYYFTITTTFIIYIYYCFFYYFYFYY